LSGSGCSPFRAVGIGTVGDAGPKIKLTETLRGFGGAPYPEW